LYYLGTFVTVLIWCEMWQRRRRYVCMCMLLPKCYGAIWWW